MIEALTFKLSNFQTYTLTGPWQEEHDCNEICLYS